jgi:DNA repair protein RadA/Sms
MGLTGEIRAISHLETRVSEIIKMGFNRCIVPQSNLKRMIIPEGITLIGVKSLGEAMEYLF